MICKIARTVVAVIFGCGGLAFAGDVCDIVVGSSHLSDIVADLAGGDAWSVQALVPPTSCPGHFDVKPSDVAALKSARLIVLHEWQEKMPVVESVLKAAGIPRDRIEVVRITGNLLVPGAQEKAVVRVAEILTAFAPERAEEFEEKAEARIERVRKAGAAAAAELEAAGCSGLNVICHNKLSHFLHWAGLAVVGEYGQDGELSASRMRALMRGGRAAGVALVVDNAQGGGLRTGAAIARDTGAGHVILSNFPGGFSGVDSWEQTLRKNVELLVRAAGGNSA